MKEKMNQLNRREFLKISGLSIAANSIWGMNFIPSLQDKTSSQIRNRVKNPYTKNGKPIMVIVEGNDVDQMLKKGFEILGGIKKLCGTNKEIILKPNYVSPERYPEVTATDTICTMIDIIRKSDSYNITVADGNSSRESTIETFKKTGLKDELDRRKVATVDLHECPSVKIKSPEWKYMDEVEVFDKIMDTPVVINMPTLKQHSQTGFTCSLKNLMGCIPKSSRRVAHRDKDRGKYSRAEMLVRMRYSIAELGHAVNPELTIIDTRKIMLNNHHFRGGGTLKDDNKIIISGDAVAVDVYAGRLMKEHNPNFSETWVTQTTELAQNLNLGIADLNNVEIIKVQI